jgi:hypothetical protein
MQKWCAPSASVVPIGGNACDFCNTCLVRTPIKKVLDKLTQMSRITRNSYRPGASDRTMVDLESPFACRSRKLDGSR